MILISLISPDVGIDILVLASGSGRITEDLLRGHTIWGQGHYYCNVGRQGASGGVVLPERVSSPTSTVKVPLP